MTSKPSPFVFQDPLPELRAPHVLACLTPWVDVGGVGSSALTLLEDHLEAKPMAELAKPGMFFDYTRYRPMVSYKDGERVFEKPNTVLRWAKGQGDHDFIFMHVLEPHAHGEDYVDAILQTMLNLGVKRYFQVGAMYDMVPHTRPLLMSGTSSTPAMQAIIEERYGMRRSNYEGPTSIMSLMQRDANRLGVETMSLLARLPQYAPLEEDYNGRLRVLEALVDLYQFQLDLNDLRERAERQTNQMSSAVEANPQLRRALEQLEERYDRRRARRLREQGGSGPEVQAPAEDTSLPLPPAIERFLRELGANN